MTSTQRSAICGLVAVHLLLAIAPVGMGFIPPNTQTLPLLWGLASIPLSQIMLLSIWVGMVAPGKALRKLAIAVLATAYIGIWPGLGENLMSTGESSDYPVTWYFQYTLLTLVLVAFLSLILAGASRWVGRILYIEEAEPYVVEPDFRYSLFALMGISTATALVLGLVRMSRMSIRAEPLFLFVAPYVLLVVVFVLNALVTVWATLGKGHVKRRLSGVFVIAILLGLSMAIAVGNSPYSQPWWLFISSSLIVLVPTSITALTLLYLRRLGFRLIAP